MTFHRGAALSTGSTLGHADSADVGPTVGNGFEHRWADDLAAVQVAGITDVRLTLDWARLQPRPATVDPAWAEWFDQVITTADTLGLRVWATLHDGSVPRWFDDEGGLGDDETFTRWWPRWVERAAERFGDSVDGWIPFAEIPAGAPLQPWRDTWGILGSGRPVVATIDPTRVAVDELVGRCSSVGVVLPRPWEPDAVVPDDVLERAATEWGRMVRDTADAADSGLVVSGFDPGHHDPEQAAAIVERLTLSLDDAIGDGVSVELCVLDPAITGADGSPGLLDRDHATTAVARAFLP
jgi:hypothetical protein